MTRVEYRKMLDEIEYDLEQSCVDIEKVQTSLNALYDYKPVESRWFVLNGRLMLLKGEYTEVISRYERRLNKEYSYKENIDLWKVLIEAYKLSGQFMESGRLEYALSKIVNSDAHLAIEKELDECKKMWLVGTETEDILNKLEKLYYISNQRLLSYVVYMYHLNKYPNMEDKSNLDLHLNNDNMGYLHEYLLDKKTIILVAEKDSEQMYDILAYMLNSIGVKVYLIGDTIEVEDEFDIKESVKVSVDNAQQFEDCIAIPAIAKVSNGQYIDSNIPCIVDWICKNNTEDDFALTLTSNHILDKLVKNEYLFRRFERRSVYEAKHLENEIGFGTAGDYYTFISRLYKTDVRNLVDIKEEYDFSIVVPVRNTTHTLYHTLRTCLEQDFDGSYEVVISDNSTDENSVAYETYKKFDDKRLKYYKTPRDLSLTKSFEYAYLMTKGRFIIPIGADDGVLPWALQALYTVLNEEQYSDMDIISWVRGFYAWPGFNGGQENQFNIPSFLKKGEISVYRGAADKWFEELIDNAKYMYNLPNMYLNSGFKRKYIKKLYKKTGRILDGASQDVYMGLTNVSIKCACISIDYPITIAGMSNSSVGAVWNMSVSGSDKRAVEKCDSLKSGKNIYAFVRSKNNLLVPIHESDISMVYEIMWMLKERNILPIESYTEAYLKKIYVNCFEGLTYLGDRYYQYLIEGYEQAKLVSSSFSDWYEKFILIFTDNISYISVKDKDKMIKKKTYKEGYTQNGGLTLDASRFGVSNIYEAVQLFKQFLNF